MEQEKTAAPKYLYKILSDSLWQESQNRPVIALPQEDNPFIHLSREDQLEKILAKYWSGVPHYVILKLDASKLKGKLVYETNPGGSSKYFHLYSGSIPLNSIVATQVIDNQKPSFTSLENVYTPRYCLQLEAAYGKGMMSEGGEEAIEHLFDSIPLEGKTALDIGSGLGGVPFYLSDKHAMRVTGLDVNAWMINEAKRRTPEHLKGKVNFILSNSNKNLPFPDNSFDIIYSKGVLTHLESKDEIFQECRRLLKKKGLLVISDALSSDERKWGENIAKLNELESLDMYPESESHYIELLKRSGFTLLSVRDDSPLCIKWNQEIINRLQDPKKRESHLKCFTETELAAAIEGYDAIAKALEAGELRTIHFVAK